MFFPATGGAARSKFARRHAKLPVVCASMTDAFENLVLSYLRRIDLKMETMAELLRQCDEGLTRVEAVVAGMRQDRARRAGERRP